MKKVAKPTIHFDTQDELTLARSDFKSLSEQRGWKRIQEFLSNSLRYYRQQLETGNIESIDELKRIRDKIAITEQLMNLPDIIVGMIEKENQVVSFDPYLDEEIGLSKSDDSSSQTK